MAFKPSICSTSHNHFAMLSFSSTTSLTSATFTSHLLRRQNPTQQLHSAASLLLACRSHRTFSIPPSTYCTSNSRLRSTAIPRITSHQQPSGPLSICKPLTNSKRCGGRVFRPPVSWPLSYLRPLRQHPSRTITHKAHNTSLCYRATALPAAQ